jgi:hypothetical protein
MNRFRKVWALLSDRRGARRTVFDRPWARSATAPYYVVSAVHDDDKCGGYTRQYEFDNDGLPYARLSEGTEYNPLVIARYAIRMWSIASLTGNAQAAARAWQVFPALFKSGRESAVWGRSADPLKMSGQFPSSIVQGAVLSALTRFWSETRDAELRALIISAAERMVTPVCKQGALDGLVEGPFLEEFPSRSHVLNGCLYGLFGLYDVIDSGCSDRFQSVSDAVENTVLRALPRFTTGDGWSRYALDVFGHAPLASAHYHRSHIDLLTVLALRTGSTTAWRTVKKWDESMRDLAIRTSVACRKSVQVIWLRDVRRLPLR